MRQSALNAVSRLNWRRTSMMLAFGTWAVIGYNALYAQNGPHPAPFFSGDAAVRQQPAQPESLSRVEPSDPAGPLRMPVAETAPAPVDEPARLLRQVQDALYQRGYDIGEVDGLMGPRTRAAITAFERDTGLAQTGDVSSALLARLGIDSHPATQPDAPARIPAPAAAPQREQSEIGRMLQEPAPSPAASSGPATATQVRTVPTTAIRIDDLIAGAPPGGSDPSMAPVPPAPVGDPMVVQVQTILANLGYAPGRIDGFVGPGTRNAIARFRADRGLPPGDGVSSDLVAELARIAGVSITR